jgi:two-component system CheB/CheR fusion protein
MEKPKVKELLDLLYKASTNELHMLDSLVEWARTKYVSEVFNPMETDLFKSVNKVFDILKENAAEKELYLSNEVREDLTVFADKRMLISILQNIISNSIKNSIIHGKITVSATKLENKIVVKVNDMGSGMSKETIDKLFSPQLKALSKEREENQGAGIGLIIVKGFLDKNGGEIWAESEEGVGSTFYFSLPAHKPLDISSN